jgi:hypothetical protein
VPNPPDSPGAKGSDFGRALSTLLHIDPNQMYRRKTSFTPLWTTSTSTEPVAKPAAAVVDPFNLPAPWQGSTGEFGLIRYAYDRDLDVVTSWLGEYMYVKHTSIMCGSRPVAKGESLLDSDFFDGARMFVHDAPSFHPDGSFRPVYNNRELDEDHFLITQPVRRTFVLKSLSAKGTKVNGEIIAQGQEVVLKSYDVIEDRVMYRACAF